MSYLKKLVHCVSLQRMLHDDRLAQNRIPGDRAGEKEAEHGIQGGEKKVCLPDEIGQADGNC